MEDKTKSNKNNVDKSLKMVDSPPPSDLASAKRYMSKLIKAYNTNEIDEKQAKCQTYMVATFTGICRDTELIERLESLESKLGE